MFRHLLPVRMDSFRSVALGRGGGVMTIPRAIWLSAMLLALLACAPDTPSEVAATSADLSSAPSTGVPTRSPEQTDASPSPVASLEPLSVEERSITRVCAAPPDTGGSIQPLACDEATQLALRLTAREGALQRTEFRFDLTCPRFAPCAVTKPNEGVVLVGLGTGHVRAVRVVQSGGSGEIRYDVYPALEVDPSTLSAEPFTPPPVSRPSTSGSDPSEVANREALPLCGIERAGASAPEARKCFVDAVLAGGQAEFISYRATAEGNPITLVFRYAGFGSVQLFLDQTRDPQSAGGWLFLWCDITLRADPHWFSQGTCSA
jgi:hypothetical protein